MNQIKNCEIQPLKNLKWYSLLKQAFIIIQKGLHRGLCRKNLIKIVWSTIFDAIE